MYANPPGVEFLRALSKVRERKKISSVKHEIRYFHVVDVQCRQRNAQKSVMHVQSCCFAN